MVYLKHFHKDVLTVRSHQWKYFVEPDTGCTFQCTYCLHWESDADVKHLHSPPDLLLQLEKDLDSMTKKQIIYIGATINPYQLLERKLRVTREILVRLLDRGLLVVILTKSPLILRDLDLLMEFQKRELIMIQFTVLTTDERKARILERAAPPVAERLEAARKLSSCGIPLHFHVSPVIPALYERQELSQTVQALADSGGQVIYSNILGMRYRNTEVFLESMRQLKSASFDTMRARYTESGDQHKKVYSPDTELIRGEMSRLRDACVQSRIDFICEFMPEFDAFQPERFEQGMFRYGLPAVYQMTRLFDDEVGLKNWATFRSQLENRFPAVDEEYLSLVKGFWDDGQLFEKTWVAGERVLGEQCYRKTNQISRPAESVFPWD